MTRRGAIALAGSAALGATFDGRARPAAAQSSPHTFKLGAAEVTVISDGSMSLPLSYVLPKTDPRVVVPLLAGRVAAGDVYFAQVNITLVKIGAAVIVVDCGGGTDFVPTTGKFPDRLEQAGFKLSDVTHVVLTHAHPDHFWGLFDPLDDASRFPDARHVMTAAERDFWLMPSVEASVPEGQQGMTLGIARRMRSLAPRIDVIKPGIAIVPGVTLLDTGGHTPGHASVLLSSDGQQLLIGGDALSHPVVSFERPDWPWGPDLDQDMAVVTRTRLLDRLATDRVGLVGYHLPWPGVGRVERKDGGYRFVAG